MRGSQRRSPICNFTSLLKEVMWFNAIILLFLLIFQFAYGVNNIEDGECKTADGVEGRCIPLKDCKTLYELLINNGHDEKVKENLRKHQCGYKGKSPAVCCQEVDEKLPPEPVYDDVSYAHLPADCGKSDTPPAGRKVNGPAPLNAWPWVAALGYNMSKSDNLTWNCLGTLVTDRHIVTSAVCFDRFKPVVARLGEHDLKSDADGAHPVEIPILKAYKYPAYDSKHRTGDVAVAVLKEPVTYSAGIRPICLPFSSELKFKNFTDSKSYIAGWGHVSSKGGSDRAQQLEGTVLVTSTEQCQAALANFKTIKINEHHICAGGGKTDSCQGDGGGPLMVQDGGKVYMIGIVSFGYKCGEVGYPGVYSNVRHYLDWIAANTV